ncbi:sulfurtransferase-like selenium metabolism protein YedF [Marasmitruncus massiliensis]|uniref:sulfurtransferase-like selenium metabolism protein YedF n=1 Tax=Marasmitruncus massiliensis TaxID=1944642 RepID=UPI000C79F581|nr:sulfurtransferase-like selenium metabolism protein YedF [Marasmitruncus massiliensis]
MTFIDAKGKNCPIPVVLAKKEIDNGISTFTIEVDNQTAVENLRRLADNQGFNAAVQEVPGGFQLAFSKTGCVACEEAEQLLSPKPRTGKWAVFIGKEIIGDGDSELGKNLMRMYFYTMTESDQLPTSLLFMNGGVKLPAGDEQIIGHLKVLADKGVEILVCGTCLNFYKIADQLKVGTVSNMYDITQRMQQADKVITL